MTSQRILSWNDLRLLIEEAQSYASAGFFAVAYGEAALNPSDDLAGDEPHAFPLRAVARAPLMSFSLTRREETAGCWRSIVASGGSSSAVPSIRGNEARVGFDAHPIIKTSEG